MVLIATALACVPVSYPQSQAPDWQTQVRKYAEAKDWNSAMRLVEGQIARAPQDMDVRTWRACVLAWSGKIPEAEKEYLEILKVSRTDADNWMGLASVYLREGKVSEAQRAISTAEELDPKRSDIHAARARILRAEGERKEAQSEFLYALHLDPGSTEAREGLTSVRRGAQHELRFGQDDDLLSYSAGFHDEFLNVVSQWISHWTTSVAGNFYQRSGAEAGKFVASITRRQSKWGALTVGGAAGHDNAVIPKSEAFLDLDHGWKTGETEFVRGVSGTNAEWRPSGVGRLGFPLTHGGDRRLSGNVSFAAGTENFAIVDQIGSFASQTYGGGLRLQITDRQDLTGFAGYQKRTENRTDTSFGLSYGIRF